MRDGARCILLSLKTPSVMDNLEPLSSDASRIAANLVQRVQDAPDAFITYEAEAFDDFVVEYHEGPYFPLPPDAESVERTLFVKYRHDLQNQGGSVTSPLYRMIRHEGDWYPFGYKDEGLVTFDLFFLCVEDGSLFFEDRSCYASKAVAQNDDRSAREKYEEVRDDLNDFLPVVEDRYGEMQPA